jgi:drug/metabolite transporter (DMT)-like permease
MSWRVRWAFVALSVIWGLPYFFIKLAVLEVSPLVVAWSRLLLAAVILLPIAVRRGALEGLSARRGAVLAFAIVEFAVPFALIPVGERWISSSVTAILIAAVPLTIALLSPFFGVHERLSLRRVLGLAIGFIGVVALVGLATVSGASGWAGVGCILLATIGYSAGPLIIQRYLRGTDPVGPLAASLTIASLLLAIPALVTFPARLPSALALASIVILGVICTAVAMLLWFYLIHHAGALTASVITYVNPLVAALLGVALLHEYLGVLGLTGLALILAGSWLATRIPAAASTGEPDASALRRPS